PSLHDALPSFGPRPHNNDAPAALPVFKRADLSNHPRRVDRCVGSAHLDRTAPTRPGGLYDFEGGAVRKKTPKRRRIEPMSATIGAETTDEARAGQCQVAHGVERLVASEFIRIAQPANVDDPMVIADDERVVQR